MDQHLEMVAKMEQLLKDGLSPQEAVAQLSSEGATPKGYLQSAMDMLVAAARAPVTDEFERSGGGSNKKKRKRTRKRRSKNIRSKRRKSRKRTKRR